MNSYKTKRRMGSMEESPFNSGAGTQQASKPTAGDLFSHFSMAMRSFQPLSFRQVESWSGPAPDLSHERILRLDGPRPFVCVVRTEDRLESALSNPATPTPQVFENLVLKVGKGLAQQVLATPEVAEDALFVRLSTPRYWPLREPEAICRIWVGATPLEIRFWMS